MLVSKVFYALKLEGFGQEFILSVHGLRKGKAWESDKRLITMAGVPGFEPGNVGIRIRCLTAWLYPKRIP